MDVDWETKTPFILKILWSDLKWDVNGLQRYQGTEVIVKTNWTLKIKKIKNWKENVFRINWFVH